MKLCPLKDLIVKPYVFTAKNDKLGFRFNFLFDIL